MSDERPDQPDVRETAEPDPTSAAAPADELTQLLQEKAALQDRLLRTAAEFDNFRKRVERERRELGEHIAAEVLRDVLPVVDNLELALNAPVTGDAAAYRQGVDLVLKQLVDVLKKRGATAIDAVGADFDPNLHEAVMHEPSDAHREGEVMAELRRGYRIGERLLRPAMVKVAKRS